MWSHSSEHRALRGAEDLLGAAEEMADDLHLPLAAITSMLHMRSEESQSKFGGSTF